MAITTVSEANAVCCLIHWLGGTPGPAGPISDEKALAAVLTLRAAAEAKLMAGPTIEETRAAIARAIASRGGNGVRR